MSMLRPVSRVELRTPGEPSAREVVKRIREFERNLNRRIPDGSRWISGYKPFVDDSGQWHLNPVMRSRTSGARSRLTVDECARRLAAQRRAF